VIYNMDALENTFNDKARYDEQCPRNIPRSKQL